MEAWAIKGKNSWIISAEGYAEFLGATKFPEVKAALGNKESISIEDLIKTISEESWPMSHPRTTPEEFEQGFQGIREDDPESYEALKARTVFVEQGKEVGLDAKPFEGSLPYERPEASPEDALNKVVLVKCLGYFDQDHSECQGCELKRPCFEEREKILQQVAMMLDQKDLEAHAQESLQSRINSIKNMVS